MSSMAKLKSLNMSKSCCSKYLSLNVDKFMINFFQQLCN